MRISGLLDGNKDFTKSRLVLIGRRIFFCLELENKVYVRMIFRQNLHYMTHIMSIK